MKMTLDVPKWYHDRLVEIKKQKGVSMTSTILRALDEEFKRQGVDKWEEQVKNGKKKTSCHLKNWLFFWFAEGSSVKFKRQTQDMQLIIFRLMRCEVLLNTDDFVEVTAKGAKYIEMVESVPLPIPNPLKWIDPRSPLWA
jgi:hypothetical protein